MTKRKRLGYDPTEIRKEQIRESVRISDNQDIGISENRDIAISKKRKEPARVKTIREQIERGETTTYYINKKTKEIMQRTLIHLPMDLVERLKRKGFESIPRKSLSEIIRERLKG